ncbi:MAG: DUF2905 domain-containing protein [Chloroflexota bacterium]|jgi:hypothetical protein
MDLGAVGRLVIALGLGLVVLGALLAVAGRLPLLRELGHLPGDIRIEREGFSCFVPLVSMLLVSLLLSLALNIILRLLNR